MHPAKLLRDTDEEKEKKACAGHPSIIKRAGDKVGGMKGWRSNAGRGRGLRGHE